MLGKTDGKPGKTTVCISNGKELKNLQIAVLTPEKIEVQSLDLYLNISQDITISVKGKHEVHLSGYFEPNNSLEEQMYPNEMDLDDDEEGEDESEDEAQDLKRLAKIVNGGKKDNANDIEGFKKGSDLDKSLKAANKNTMKNQEEPDSDSDDEEEGEEEGEFDDIGALDIDAEEEDDDEEIDSSDIEDDEVLLKLQNLKKSQEKHKSKKNKKKAVSSSDSSSEEEQPKKKKHKSH